VKRFLREPLLHFLLLGAALFAFNALRSDNALRAGDDRIVVSRGRVENLIALHTKTWQRPPTAIELRGLVDDFILEEALYREGKALRLDRDDTIIRRRVRQKMEFVVDDIFEQAQPSEAQLEEWLAEHPELYAHPERYRFRQLYLSAEQHGGRLATDAVKVLAELRALPEDADPRGLGDPTLLEHAFADASVQTIVATFGQEFADGLAALPGGEWSGPVPSTYGLHLVRIDGRTLGELPALDEVRAAVVRDWSFTSRETAARRFYDELLARYEVEVDWPEDAKSTGEAQQP